MQKVKIKVQFAKKLSGKLCYPNSSSYLCISKLHQPKSYIKYNSANLGL
jgi:hypothetical protein